MLLLDGRKAGQIARPSGTRVPEATMRDELLCQRLGRKVLCRHGDTLPILHIENTTGAPTEMGRAGTQTEGHL